MDMEQANAKYNIDPKNFRIEIYLAYDGTTIVIAYKDNNYVEWVSIGHLQKDKQEIKECIHYLLDSTPLPYSTSAYWNSFKTFTGIHFEELFVLYKQIRVIKRDDSFLSINGDEIKTTFFKENVHEILFGIYEKEKQSLEGIKTPTADIIKELKQNIANIELEEKECPFPWALNHVSDYAFRILQEQQSKYMFHQNKEVKELLFQLHKLHSRIYNTYMTHAR